MANNIEAASAAPAEWTEYNAPHEDLRDYLDRVERIGEMRRIAGVSWDLEMGAISEMFGAERPDGPPTLLFENIPGYRKGLRVVWGTTNSRRRFAIGRRRIKRAGCAAPATPSRRVGVLGCRI